MDWTVWLAVFGSLASVLGLVVAIVQTLRYRAAEQSNRALRRARDTQIWGNIALALQAFERIEPLRQELASDESVPAEVRQRLIAARQSVVDQYLRLLEQAILAEPEFTVETVELWAQNGRLENDWRRQQAMRFVSTEALKKAAGTPRGT